MIDDELAAPVTEPRQIRIVRSEDGAVLLDRLPPEQFKSRRRQCRPVPLRILEQEELEPLQRDAERFSRQRRTACAGEGGKVRAALQPVPKECSVWPARAFPNLANHIGVGFGKRVVANLGAYQRFRVVGASRGIVDDAIGDSIQRVAACHRRGRSRVELGFRNEIFGRDHYDLGPKVGRKESLPVDRWVSPRRSRRFRPTSTRLDKVEHH